MTSKPSRSRIQRTQRAARLARCNIRHARKVCLVWLPVPVAAGVQRKITGPE